MATREEGVFGCGQVSVAGICACVARGDDNVLVDHVTIQQADRR